MPDDTTEAQISRMIDAVSEYMGLTHEAPWPKKRQAARDAVIELGRLAYSAATVRRETREEERERIDYAAVAEAIYTTVSNGGRFMDMLHRQEWTDAVRSALSAAAIRRLGSDGEVGK